MKPLRFREDVATQAAGVLLALTKGKRMDRYNLVKLLYLCERESLKRWGRPITFDIYVRMPFGPALSMTYDRIKHHPEAGKRKRSYWDRYIVSEGKMVCLRAGDETPRDRLSPAEQELIEGIFAEHAHKTFEQLKQLTHGFDEWHDPHGSSEKIEMEELLRAVGKDDKQIRAIIAELEEITLIEHLLC